MAIIDRDRMRPVLLRLQDSVELEDEDVNRLVGMISSVETVPPKVDLKREGEHADTIHIVLKGLACRYKILPDGRRQIMALLIPGDPCDFQVFLLNRMDHYLSTLATSEIATIPREAVEAAVESNPRLARAFWYSTLRDEAILREWLVNIGRRNAYERLAHFLWELYLRHDAVDLIRGKGFALQLRQNEIADILGLTTVYVNKVLQKMRADGLIELDQREIRICNRDALRRIAAFDAEYLHQRNSDERIAN